MDFKKLFAGPKSLKLAYTLMAFLGLQGIHQFYLGNWRRGAMIAFFIHAPMFWFAYLDGQARTTGVPMAENPSLLVPLLWITVGLFVGLGLFIWDLFTLHKQARKLNLAGSS